MATNFPEYYIQSNAPASPEDYINNLWDTPGSVVVPSKDTITNAIGKVSIDLINRGELPPEILDQLKVLNRIKFPLKPTTASAVSRSASQPDSSNPEAFGDTYDPEFDVEKLINSVKNMEDLVEQLEDMSDELTKDMSIPFMNNSIQKAVKRLSPDATSITKDVFDKAIAMMDYFPLMVLGQDPVLGALTGDGSLKGPYINCNEMSKSLGKIMAVAPKRPADAESVVSDASVDVMESWEKSQAGMFLEIILQLWWNILWAKFIVDMAIINPARNIVALPLDTIIVFFKNDCGGRFKKPKKECVIGTAEAQPPYSNAKGPLNKILNKIRKFLLCKIPLALYPRYNPIVPIDCSNLETGDCPQDTEGNTKAANNVSDMEAMYDDISNFDTCQNTKDWTAGITKDKFDTMGIPPECVGAGKVVLDAVISDALTPGGKTKYTSTASFLSQTNKNGAL